MHNANIYSKTTGYFFLLKKTTIIIIIKGQLLGLILAHIQCPEKLRIARTQCNFFLI
jgi:hypothetical protein